MPPELLKAAAEANRWSAIYPEIALGVLALLLLALEILLPKKNHDVIPGIAIVGQVGVLLAFVWKLKNGAPFVVSDEFNGLIRLTREGQFMRVFFLFSSILVSVLGVIALARQKMPRIEFFAITLVVSAAMMLLAQSNHFVLLFVALETVTVGFYVLVSYFRSNPLTLEAGLKYLVTGALSSALLLFGIVLLYGVAGNPTLPGSSANSMSFGALHTFLAANPNNFLASVGIVFVLAGVAFKIGAVPFQIWIPDVYQGAPTPVTAFLAVSSKAAGFAVLLVLTQHVFAPYQTLTISVLSVMAGATILFGNLAALTQHNVKRLIGLSGVSHAGYLLIGVVAAATQPLAVSAIYFYLVAYLLASFAVFGVMTHLAGTDDTDQDLEHYHGLAKSHPFLAGVLAIGLGSLAGIPPLAGFMGKLVIFIAAFKAGLYALLAIAIVGVVVSIYYYFGWIKSAWFVDVANTKTAPILDEDPHASANAQEIDVRETTIAASPPANATAIISTRPLITRVSLAAGMTLAVLTVATVILGLYQGALGQWLFPN